MASYKEIGPSSAKKLISYFGMNYYVLSSINKKPQLAISINSTLPCFDFIIGNPASEDGFKLNLMYDTRAALTVEYSYFHLKVVKLFHFLVKNIWSTLKDDYSPIRLCGVLNNNNDDSKLKEGVTYCCKRIFKYKP